MSSSYQKSELVSVFALALSLFLSLILTALRFTMAGQILVYSGLLISIVSGFASRNTQMGKFCLVISSTVFALMSAIFLIQLLVKLL